MSTRRTDTILVSEVMLPLDDFPVVFETVILKETLEAMGKFRLGVACVVDNEKHLVGVLTDGDIRRKLLSVQKPFSAFFVDDTLDHAVRSPVTIGPEDTLIRAVDVMEEKRIWDLPVVDGQGHLVGLLHLHPAIQALLEIPH